ncbi:MAG: glycosyltransferase [Planctomycetota bacterium]|nr:MAG: glycosyltransferase [Planctomycetota bacterium]
MPHPSESDPWSGVCAIMPALDEEGSIGAVISNLRRAGIRSIIVGDNGSRDRTAEVARAAGATVVPAPHKGYGRACLAALAALPPSCHTVLFCDADGSDDLRLVPALVRPVARDEQDLVIGSRALGRQEAGALTPPQLIGNWVSTTLMRALYRVRVTDLGPFRAVSRAALQRLQMQDPAFGWTAEMQVKAFRLGLRVAEVPVDAKCRTAGRSKISGRVIPVFRAGWAILSTVVRYARADLAGAQQRRPSTMRRRSRHLALSPQYLRQRLATELMA